MADDANLQISINVDAGSSQSEIESKIIAPLEKVQTTGEETAASVTESMQKIEDAAAASGDAAKPLADSLQEATTAAEGVGEALASAGEDGAAGIEQIGAIAQDVAANVAELGAQVSTGLLSGGEAAVQLADQLSGLQAAVEAAYGSLEAAPSEIVAQLEEIGAAIEEMGAASDDFNATLIKTTAKLEEFTTKADEGGATLRTMMVVIRQLNAYFQQLSEQVIATYGSIENAPPEIQEVFKRLQAGVQGAIVKMQELRETQATLMYGTQQLGSQIMVLGLAGEHLGKNLGDTGEMLGKAAQTAGILALAYEHLSHAWQSMKLNEFTGGLTKVGIQAALVAASFTLAFGAGEKFMESTDQGSQSLQVFRDWLHEVTLGTTSWHEVMVAAESMLSTFSDDLFNAESSGHTFGSVMSDINEIIKMGTGDMSVYGDIFDKNNARYLQGVKIQMDLDAAHRKIITDEQALEQAMDERAKSEERVNQAVTDALEKADLRTEAEYREASAVRVATQAQAEAASEEADAAQKEADAAQKVADKAKAEVAAYEAALEKKKESVTLATELTNAGQKEEKIRQAVRDAVDKETAALKAKVDKAKEEATEDADVAAKLKDVATAAQAYAKNVQDAANVTQRMLDATQALNDAIKSQTSADQQQETEIQKAVANMKDLVNSNDRLTESDKARYAQMIAIAEQIDKESTAEQKAKDALDAETAATDKLTAAKEKSSASRKKNVETADQEWDAFKHGTDAAGQEMAAMVKLNNEMQRTDGVTQQVTKTTSDFTVVVGGAIEQKKRELAALQEEQATQTMLNARLEESTKGVEKNAIAYDTATGSYTNLSQKVKDAQPTWDAATKTMSNVDTDTDNARDGMVGVQAALDKATNSWDKAAVSQDRLDQKMKDDATFWQQFRDDMHRMGIETLPEYSEQIDVTGKKVDEVTPKMSAHAAAVMKVHDSYEAAGATMTTDVATAFDTLIEKASLAAAQLRSVRDELDYINAAAKGDARGGSPTE